jgi:predicted transcriptional regulator
MKKDPGSIILTRQELNIMKVIWKNGSATVKQVKGIISKNKQTAYTTIATTMGILELKGALIHTESGRAFVYEPLLSRRQAVRNQVRDMLIHYFDGKHEKLIAFVMQHEIKSPGQLAKVRSLLETAESSGCKGNAGSGV